MMMIKWLINILDRHNQKRFERKLLWCKYKLKQFERKQMIEEMKTKRKNKKKMSTSKRQMLFIDILCVGVVIFSCYETNKYGDFSALVTVIGIISAIVNYKIYANKATKENCIGGIVYDSVVNNSDIAG